MRGSSVRLGAVGLSGVGLMPHTKELTEGLGT